MKIIRQAELENREREAGEELCRVRRESPNSPEYEQARRKYHKALNQLVNYMTPMQGRVKS